MVVSRRKADKGRKQAAVFQLQEEPKQTAAFQLRPEHVIELHLTILPEGGGGGGKRGHAHSQLGVLERKAAERWELPLGLVVWTCLPGPCVQLTCAPT